MAINTPAPTNKVVDPFGLRARAELRAEVIELRQLVVMLKYRVECMERREQERLHLERMKVLHHTQYSHAISGTPSSQAEQVQPGDISHVPTHDLPELPSVESVGEDEDNTAIHAAISKAARVTSHPICREHPVMDLLTGLSEHAQSCQQGTSVIFANASVGNLLLKPLTNFPDIRLRHNGLLPDDQFMCASYEDGGSNGQGTL